MATLLVLTGAVWIMCNPTLNLFHAMQISYKYVAAGLVIHALPRPYKEIMQTNECFALQEWPGAS